MELQKSRTVSAAELVRNFAHWREVGAHEPVRITHHGRETHVFMGLGRFRQIAGNDAPDPGGDRFRALAGWMHQGLILCRSDLTIEHVNPVALAMTQAWDRDLEDRLLWEAMPEWSGALAELHIRRSLASGEPSAADIPSPFRPDSWLHFQTFPFDGGIALLLRDISEEMQRHRLADVKSAILAAMGLHGGVGYVRLSNRGFIANLDPGFSALVGLPAARLSGSFMPDLVELAARPRFRETLERVLDGEGDRRVGTRLLTNSGAVLPVDAGLVRLAGAYGTEGVVMVLTPARPDSEADS